MRRFFGVPAFWIPLASRPQMRGKSKLLVVDIEPAVGIPTAG